MMSGKLKNIPRWQDPIYVENARHVKDYDGNNPQELGFYDWHRIPANKTVIRLQSDGSKQYFGFKLQWRCQNDTNISIPVTEHNKIQNPVSDCDTDVLINGTTSYHQNNLYDGLYKQNSFENGKRSWLKSYGKYFIPNYYFLKG